MSAPRIETDRLILRGREQRDAQPLIHFLVDPINTKFLPPVDHNDLTPEMMNQRLDRSRTLWSEQGFGIWSIEQKTTEKWIGYCGLKWLPDNSDIELLYGIDRAHWNQGFVTEAARASLAFGFTQAKLDRICAIAVPENRGSTRVMEKVGMEYQGIRTHYGMKVAFYLKTREAK